MNKTSTPSRSPEHFERLYRDDPDPWQFATSAYEQQKYETTLAALSTRKFQMGLEIGCSIGVLTERLASRCEMLIGVDFALSAVAAASARCAIYSGVRIEHMRVPEQWPDGQFDLIVFSEVLYFFSEGDLLEACAQTMLSIMPGGQVLLVNYTEPTDDPHSGDSAASSFINLTASRLRPLLQLREPRYRLDLLLAQGGTARSY